MSRVRVMVAVLVVSTSFAVACTDDGGGGGSSAPDPEAIDYEAIGLWDDGPCDETLEPLVIGLQTVFESPVLSLEPQAIALEASAEAFNERGGANGACIEVHTCDDGSNVDQALACVRELDAAGVVATVNDQTTAGLVEVTEAMGNAGIPRIATNVGPEDWGDPLAFPIDASSTGLIFVMPQGLIEAGVADIGIIRPEIAQTAALVSLLTDIYADQGATFPIDPVVPAGTTDYSQFILAAEGAGAGGIMMAIGDNEVIQIVHAGEQLDTDLLIAMYPFSYEATAGFGEFAEQFVAISSFPPAMSDLPVYTAMRADLAASGDEALQPQNLLGSPIRSWIGLYALLKMIRDDGMTGFTREGIVEMLRTATDVPMLGLFGDQSWTPDESQNGLFARVGTTHWGIYRWDPDAEAPGFDAGNFVEVATVNFDDIICGSPFGAPEPC